MAPAALASQPTLQFSPANSPPVSTLDVATGTDGGTQMVGVTRWSLQSAQRMYRWVEGDLQDDELLKDLYLAVGIEPPKEEEEVAPDWNTLIEQYESLIENRHGVMFKDDEGTLKAAVVGHFIAVRDILVELHNLQRQASNGTLGGDKEKLSRANSFTMVRRGSSRSLASTANQVPNASIASLSATTPAGVRAGKRASLVRVFLDNATTDSPATGHDTVDGFPVARSPGFVPSTATSTLPSRRQSSASEAGVNKPPLSA